MKFGIAQIALDSSVKLNLSKIGSCITEATLAEADVVCFPECSLTGYLREFRDVDWSEVTQALHYLKHVATINNITIVVGTPYLEGVQTFNAAMVISAEDELKYFKKNLTDFDQQYFVAGRGTLIFEVKSVKCGLLICRDQNDPSLAQAYASDGVKIIFLLAAHYYPLHEAQLKLEKNRALPIARAVENKIVVAKANAVGSQADCISLGHSMIVNAEGIVTCEAGEKEEIILYSEL